MKLIYQFKNYKLLKDFQGELISGNLYLVRGRNEIGKSSLVQGITTLFRAKNICEKPLSDKETDGNINGRIIDFKGADGENYKISFNFTDKQESFTMVYPDTNITKKVGDITSVFKYNDFTVDDFIGWGSTAEGRRKQANVLLAIMPANIKDAIAAIDAKINEKNGVLFLQRKEKNALVDGLKAIVTREEKTPIDKELIEKGPKAENLLKKLQATLDGIKHKEDDILLLNRAMSLTNEVAHDVDIEDRLTTLRTTFNDGIKALIDSIKVENSEELRQRIETGTKLKANADAEKKREDELIKNKKELQEAFEAATKIDNDIKKLRQDKKDLFAKAKFDGMVLEGDELFVERGEKLFPMNEQSVSYSVMGLIITELILRSNPDLPFVVIGKAAEYDSAAKEKLYNLAKTYDGILMADQVEDGIDKIEVKAYELIKPTTKA